MKWIGSTPAISKAGTPDGRQLARAEKGIPPDSALSFSRFMISFAQGLMLGLLRSAMRNVGCAPVARNSLLVTNGWAGSLRVGLGSPGMATKSALPKTHAVSLEEKSGADPPCSAASLGPAAAQASPVKA